MAEQVFEASVGICPSCHGWSLMGRGELRESNYLLLDASGPETMPPMDVWSQATQIAGMWEFPIISRP